VAVFLSFPSFPPSTDPASPESSKNFFEEVRNSGLDFAQKSHRHRFGRTRTSIVESMLARAELPNLAKIRAGGNYTP